MEAGKEMKKKALLIVAACACFITGCGAEKSTENKMKITESLHSASGESVSCLASVFTTQDGYCIFLIQIKNQVLFYVTNQIVNMNLMTKTQTRILLVMRH